MRIRLAFAFLVLMWPLAGRGQSPDFDEVRDDLVDRELSSALSGLTTLDAAGASATNRDYLTFFTSALESLAKSKGESITFDWNFPMKIAQRDDVIKAQLVLRKPPLSSGVTTKLGDKVAAIETLRGELSFDDDIALTISYGPKAGKAATEAKQQVQMFATNFRSLVHAEARDAQRELAEAELELTTNQSVLEKEAQTAIPRANRDKAVAVQALVDQERLYLDFFVEPFAEAVALEKTARSKFTYDLYARSRYAAAGPDEYKVKARYERPLSQKAAERVRAMEANLNDSPALRADMQKGVSEEPADRIVASIDLQWVLKSQADLSQFGLEPVATASSRSVSGSISYGRDLFRPKSTIDRRGRIDVELKYDDVTGDKQRHDRLVGSVTYTQKLSEKVQIPISLSYANHSDYLTNVNRKLNAHFGLSWKIPGL